MLAYSNARSSWKFNFTNQIKQGFISVEGIPIYHTEIGYGFVHETGALPSRTVHTNALVAMEQGIEINEASFADSLEQNGEDYNHYGMAFRVHVPAGAYKIIVRTTSPLVDTMVSITGMRPQDKNVAKFWDAAKLVPRRTIAEVEDQEWQFEYVKGNRCLDVEIEPRRPGVAVGIAEIVIKPIAPNVKKVEKLPTVFLLGDSTVKSYTFEEAPMHGWGQVIDRLFDVSKVRVINYSMGGRSFRNAYTEGRLNDILMTGMVGDYIVLQFGHNDEREDEYVRFGRGSTELMYKQFITEVYLPAIKARGMIPVFVTPMSRINVSLSNSAVYSNSFVNRKFPEIMKNIGRKYGIPVVDLNARSLAYYNHIGVEATTALFMSIEAGETPAKTNDGTYANGHPSNKIDGTHYKEALAHQFARLIVTEIIKLRDAGEQGVVELASFVKEEVIHAIRTDDWDNVFPQLAKDALSGPNAYYRNQIEKLLQLRVLAKDEAGLFHPNQTITTSVFQAAICKLLNIDMNALTSCDHTYLTREMMGVMLYDAYQAKFTVTPTYMTDYNAVKKQNDSNYDPNLDVAGEATTYVPLIPYEKLSDLEHITPAFADKVKAAYELGLFRSEKGIKRGKVCNGTELEPQKLVTRAKAAKILYFMWVLSQPLHVENDLAYVGDLENNHA